MNQHYQSVHTVLTAIEEKLASARSSGPAEVLDAIVAALANGRGYAWVSIYLAAAELGVCQASSGSNPAPASMKLASVNSEIAVPIRLGVRTLGLIIAETGRPANNARQERVLLQQVAKLMAKYLTSDRAKGLLRNLRENAYTDRKSVV